MRNRPGATFHHRFTYRYPIPAGRPSEKRIPAATLPMHTHLQPHQLPLPTRCQHILFGIELHTKPRRHRVAARHVSPEQEQTRRNGPTDDHRADSLPTALGYRTAVMLRPDRSAAPTHQSYPHQRLQTNTDSLDLRGRFPTSNAQPGAPQVWTTKAVLPRANRSHPLAVPHRHPSTGQRALHTPQPTQEAACSLSPPPCYKRTSYENSPAWEWQYMKQTSSTKPASSMLYILEICWWNFGDYPVDELSPQPSFDQPSQHHKNSLATEEKAKFHQHISKMYNMRHEAGGIFTVPDSGYLLVTVTLTSPFGRKVKWRTGSPTICWPGSRRNVTRWARVASSSGPSMSAKCLPIQIREPAPKGKNALRGSCFSRSGVNRSGS